MKIYTKKGDKGQTSLLGGTRVPKHHIRINAYGTVDELNSFLGLLHDLDGDDGRRGFIQNIQSRLFTVGASLAAETERAREFKPDITDKDIESLEQAMDAINDVVPPLKNFILPGGHLHVSYCHICRCICRRAERLVMELSEQWPVEENVIIYLNRLSDYLFMLARKIAQELGAEEIAWKPRK